MTHQGCAVISLLIAIPSFALGIAFGARLVRAHLTGLPCPRTGVCGPYDVEGRFYYLVPEAVWERMKISVLSPMEYDT